MVLETSFSTLHAAPRRSEDSASTLGRSGAGAAFLSWPAIALCLLAYAGGAAVRYFYIFEWNPVYTLLFSDMEGYLGTVKNFLDPSYVESIADTVHPPGTRWLFGVLYGIDPSYNLIMAMQWVLSALYPWLLFGIAWELFGRRAAWAVLVFASLYYPLFDYSCYLLSEAPFGFLMTLSFYALVLSIKSGPGVRIAWGLAGGIVLGASAALKTVSLPAAFCVFLLLIAYERKHRCGLWRPLFAASLGLLLVLAPLAVRATRLSGKPCLVANDAARNVLIGHYGDIGSVIFHDWERNIHHEFGCPAAVQKGYRAKVDVNFGAYDNRAALNEAWRWTRENFWRSLLYSVEHVFDLFYGTLAWPSNCVPGNRAWVILYSYVFLCLVFLPMIVHVCRHWRAMLRLDPAWTGDLMTLAPLGGIVFAAFIALGEPRYRIPFDGFMLLLAVRAFVPPRPEEARALCAPKPAAVPAGDHP